MKGRPKLIGVTGGIGSGKSTVCKIFEVLGHKVYYADNRAKWLMNNEHTLIDQVKALFGEKAYHQEALNRKYISEQVFKNPDLLKKLNTLVHPAVAQDLKNWVEDNQEDKVLFDEAALLFEIGSYKKMDSTILVTASEKVRIDRVLKRDPHRTPESIKEIIDQQMKDEDKIPLADYVIENEGAKSVIKQTMGIYQKLL